MDTNPVDISEFTDEQIFADTSILNDFLQYQIARERTGKQGREFNI